MTTDSGAGAEPAGATAEADVTGELPAGWMRATIGELCDVNPRGFDEEPGDDELISQVPMAAVEAATGRMDASTQVRYGEVKKKSLTRFQENDVLFAKITPCMENGKIAKAQGLAGGRALGSTEFHVLRSHGAVLPEYLMHFLLQPHVRRTAERNMTGAVGQRRVPRPYLAALEIPVPPLAEQHRIIAKLDDQLAHVEAGEAAAYAAQALVGELWLAFLDSLVHGDARQGIRQPELKKVAAVAAVSSGVQKSGKRRPRQNKYPFLRVANVPRGSLDLKDVHEIELFDGEIERYRLNYGDLLVVEGNGSPDQIGRAAMWRGEIEDCVHQNHLIRVTPCDALVPEYLELVWNAPSTAAQLRNVAASTSGLYTLNTSKVKSILVPVPAIRDQELLVESAASTRTMLNEAAAKAGWAATKAAGLRSALLYTAFTGALVPQDPDDEPASVLLNRIRARRAVGAKPAKRKRAPRTTSQTAPQTSGRPVSSGTQEALPL